MSQPSRPLDDPSKPFADMVERLKRNPANEFAGAIVVVTSDGTILSQAFINPTPDTAGFWSTVKAMVEVAVTDYLQAKDKAAGFGYR